MNMTTPCYIRRYTIVFAILTSPKSASTDLAPRQFSWAQKISSIKSSQYSDTLVRIELDLGYHLVYNGYSGQCFLPL